MTDSQVVNFLAQLAIEGCSFHVQYSKTRHEFQLWYCGQGFTGETLTDALEAATYLNGYLGRVHQRAEALAKFNQDMSRLSKPVEQ